MRDHINYTEFENDFAVFKGGSSEETFFKPYKFFRTTKRLYISVVHWVDTWESPVEELVETSSWDFGFRMVLEVK